MQMSPSIASTSRGEYPIAEQDAPDVQPLCIFWFFRQFFPPETRSLCTEMSDDKLIIAVSSFPCIYDVSLDTYRDNLMRNEAWRKIAEIVGDDGDD